MYQTLPADDHGAPAGPAEVMEPPAGYGATDGTGPVGAEQRPRHSGHREAQLAVRGAGRWRLTVPCSTPERTVVFMRLNPSNTCCTRPPHFRGDKATHAPAELNARGVTHDVWQHWVDELEDRVANKFTGDSCWLHFLWCIPPLLCMYGLGDCNYQTILHEWQADFNREVLEPLGMWAKTMSAFATRRSMNKVVRVTYAWIAVAMTPEERLLLETEPHVWRYHGGSACFGGEPRYEEACCTRAMWCCTPRAV